MILLLLLLNRENAHVARQSINYRLFYKLTRIATVYPAVGGVSRGDGTPYTDRNFRIAMNTAEPSRVLCYGLSVYTRTLDVCRTQPCKE